MKDYPIKLGSILFTMVEPWKGYEVEYNRWYERDHFYAGCMVGAYNFAGRRFVATRPYKQLRYPVTSPITPDPMTGSYLALYWVLAGHHDDWNRWAVDQVKWLHENGRMFPQRDHIHTLLYELDWSVQRDPDGVSIELALDHDFQGLVVIAGDAVEGVERSQVHDWYRDTHLPSFLAGSPAALCASFTPLPLLGDAPGDVPRTESADKRFLQLYFLDSDPRDSWGDTFARHGDELDKSGLARLVWASPFIPTKVGTDAYTDQLG